MKKNNLFCVALWAFCMGSAKAEILEPVGSYAGSHASERCAYWVNPVGDVNGDGLDDFMLGVCHSGRYRWEAGTAYLILGRSQADWGMRRWLNHAADAVFFGDYANYAGYPIAGRGDINGDGLDDFIIGSGGRISTLTTYPGRAFLIFGRDAADWGSSFKLSTQSDVIFNGENALDQAGVGNSIIGDLNGDGYDDFIISANDNDTAALSAGKVYLFLGKSDWPSSLSLTSCDASFVGRYANQGVGYCVSRLGDVNGDDVPDFIIGSYNDKRETYLIFGRASVNWGQNFSLSKADVIFYSESSGDRAGFLSADAGDVNGDGLDDILIGAFSQNAHAGKAYLIFGRSSGWPSVFQLSNADASFIGEVAGDEVGTMKSLAGGGDYNGDGYGDFLIGAPFNDQAANDAGKMYLILGQATGWKKNVNLSTMSTYFLGADTSNYVGDALNFVGDLNGDGGDDFVVSAPYNSYSYKWAGQNYIFLGYGSNYSVTGDVTYGGTGALVPGVKIAAGGDSPMTVTTGDDGAYRINYPKSQTFTVMPSKTQGAYLDEQGLTPYDAGLILRHVVGLELLAAGQETLADVNEDGTITLADAVLIARCYANMEALTGSYAGEWVFTPTSRTYATIQSDYSGEDYSAYLLGDVDLSWTPGGSLSKASATSLSLTSVEDRLVLDLSIPSESGMIATDIRLRFNPDQVRFESVEKGDLVSGFYCVFNEIQPGHLVVGFFGATPVDETGIVCRVIFRRSQETVTPASVLLEQFVLNGNVPVNTAFGSPSSDSGGERVQLRLASHPNPFNAEAAIEYTIPAGQKIRLILYNLRGERVCVLADGYRDAGSHRVRWNGRDERNRETASGVYLCRLESAGRTQQIKLLKVN